MRIVPSAASTGRSELFDLPFDQYERYAIAATIVNAVRLLLGQAHLQVLDVGGAGAPLQKFLSRDQVLTADLDAQANDGYVRADGIALPFRDEVFEIVTSQDTLEHVPQSNRVAFLRELVRVTRRILVLNGPFSSREVEAAERLILQEAKEAVGENHPIFGYLGEHARLTLPILSETLTVLEDVGLVLLVLPNGPLVDWIERKVFKFHLAIAGGRQKPSREFDRITNRRYTASASEPPCYRHAVIGVRNHDRGLLKAIELAMRPASGRQPQR